MNDPFLHKNKPNPNPKQWDFYFSSILIQIKVVAQA